MYTVDLNSDLGESFGNYKIGNDDKVIPLISSANVENISICNQWATAERSQVAHHPNCSLVSPGILPKSSATDVYKRQRY